MNHIADFRFLAVGIVAGMCLALAGCGSKSPATKSDPPSHSETENAGKPAAGGDTGDAEVPRPSPRKPAFGTVDPGSSQGNQARNGTPATDSPAEISRQLKPLQVIVGQWQGIPQKLTVETDQPAWRWDFSVRNQPALAFESKAGGYFKKGRLTYLPQKKQFRLIAELTNGAVKTYTGTATAPVQDVPAGDGKTFDRTFTLTLTQVDPQPKAREDLYRVAIQQVKNDRYLLIVSHKRGTRVAEINRIGNQRSGTSFAAKLDDYGDKTCVISQGLGTIAVTHKGKTYYVCCSGCQKAFNAEPEKWIASFEEWKRKKGKR